MKLVKVDVFVGSVLNATKGGWITLPMDENELKAKIDAFGFDDAEFEIMDLETDMPVSVTSYRDVYRLNRDLQLFSHYEDVGLLKLLMTAYCYTDENLDDALELINRGNFEYYDGVYDEKSLGEAVVASGKLGWMLSKPSEFANQPEVKEMAKKNLLNLIKVSQYLDYEAIGHDWVCKGCRIYPILKTAIMEVPAA